MGGAIGVALFGTILNTRLPHHRAEVVPAEAQSQLTAASAPASANDVTAIQNLPEPAQTWVQTAFTQAMNEVSLVAVPFMAVALVVALTLARSR